MDIIAEYKRMTGEDESETKCASCENAIWRIMYGSALDAYRTAQNQNCSLCGHCTATGKPITAYVYYCSGHTASAEAQRAAFAEL